jgi:hypothetical protein
LNPVDEDDESFQILQLHLIDLSSSHTTHYTFTIMSVSTYDTEFLGAEAYGDSMSGIEVFDSRRFFSDGPNGRFELRTYITRVSNDPRQDLFNIGFGVWDDALQTVDDKVQTRNDDFRRILGTIAVIALDFLNKYPSASLYAERSTSSRTRLYQREISNVLDAIPQDLRVYGFVKADNMFVDFKRCINFDRFLLSLSNY